MNHDHKQALEGLFTEGFHDWPNVNPNRADSRPYQLGYTAAERIHQLDDERNAIFAQARELSGGNVGRVGFVR